MPHARIETNLELGKGSAEALAKELSEFTADLLGKPEGFVQTCVAGGLSMTFGGTEAPTAYVTLRSIGLPDSSCPDFAARLCAFVQERLDVSQDRVFVAFENLERSMFGWNGKTFA